MEFSLERKSRKMTYISKYSCFLGDIVLASEGQAITGLWFEEQAHFGSTLIEPIKEEELLIFTQTKEFLDVYFSGQVPVNRPSIEVHGTPFQRAVLQVVLEIPYGETMTYKEIAQHIAVLQNKKAMSAQAVGNAIGKNPISLLIPCHRVIGSDGRLVGYAGGIERKKKLLDFEKRLVCKSAPVIL